MNKNTNNFHHESIVSVNKHHDRKQYVCEGLNLNTNILIYISSGRVVLPYLLTSSF